VIHLIKITFLIVIKYKKMGLDRYFSGGSLWRPDTGVEKDTQVRRLKTYFKKSKFYN